ncbi:MAG: hypothetical protein ACI3XE_06515 [Eubacteriales bacterium]
MTRDEILGTKQYLDIKDLMDIFGCGICKAQSLMRCIKHKRDTLHIKGKIAVCDYEFYMSGRANAE